jgi:hypothetical protein
MEIFSPKLPEESIVLTFNFAPDLGSLTLSGTPTITASVATGSDPNPSAILNGSPQMDSTQTQWFVPVTGGVNGTSYVIAVVAPTASSTTVLEIRATILVSS